MVTGVIPFSKLRRDLLSEPLPTGSLKRSRGRWPLWMSRHRRGKLANTLAAVWRCPRTPLRLLQLDLQLRQLGCGLLRRAQGCSQLRALAGSSS
jgi:hypothetical protein